MDFSSGTTRFAQYLALTSSTLKDIGRLKSLNMEKYGLSAMHTDCLWHLYQAGGKGLAQRALLDLEQVDRAQISRVMRELAAAGYVEQSPGEGAYKRPYRLTDTGARIAAEVHGLILEINHFVSRDIPPEDLAVFYNTLRTIAANLSKAVKYYT